MTIGIAQLCSLLLLPAALDVLYGCVACGFVGLWHEGETTLYGRHILWQTVFPWLAFFLIMAVLSTTWGGLVDETTVEIDDDKLWQFWQLCPSTVTSRVCFGLLAVLLCGRNLWRTRRRIVNGGPAPPTATPSTTTTATTTHSPKQLPRLRNKVIVVTGANTGIGKETVHGLARDYCDESCTLVLLCRTVSKGQAAWQELVDQQQQHQQQPTSRRPHPIVAHLPQHHVIPCDLTDYASIRAAATAIATTACGGPATRRPHILINNAGVMLPTLSYTTDGHETCLQANVLGHILLTVLLRPTERLLTLTSSTYRLAVDDFPHHDDYDRQLDFCHRHHHGATEESPRPYTLFGQYAATKWANLLFTHQWQRLHTTSSTSTQLATAAIHPGLVRTDVTRNMPWYLRYPNQIFGVALATLQKTPSAGAWGTLHCAAVATVEELRGTTTTTTTPDGSRGRIASHGKTKEQRSFSPPPPGLGWCYWVNRKPQALVVEDALVEQQAAHFWEWCLTRIGLTDEEREDLQTLLPNKKST